MRTGLPLLLLLLSTGMHGYGQSDFSQIPEYPESYNATTVSARVIDALGFRYHWATRDLREEDLAFRPAEGSRSIRETAEHVHTLVMIIYNTHFNKPNQIKDLSDLSFDELRNETLGMLWDVREFLVNEDPDPEEMKIRLQMELPYWNLLNGPIADAIYHTGQVVLLRRSNGNPVRAGVSVLMGTAPN